MAVEDISGTLSQLRMCSISVSDEASASAAVSKSRVESLLSAWDEYQGGVSSLVDMINSRLASLGSNSTQMSQNAAARGVYAYIRSSGVADVLSGLATSSCAYGGDPINMSTGNYILQSSDISLGIGSRVSIERTYNSLPAARGLFGRGWSSILDESLCDIGGRLEHVCPDGRRRTFMPSGQDGTWRTIDEVEETITRDERGYLLEGRDGTARLFDRDGRLTGLSDAMGHLATIRRDDHGIPVRIEAGDDRHLDVLCHEGRVASITDHTGRQVRYSYGEGGLLLDVTRPDRTTWSYGYDVKGRLCRIADPLGNAYLEQSYDEAGRVVRQRMAGGAQERLSYLDGLTIHDSPRTGRVSYTHDEAGRATKIECGSAADTYTYSARGLWSEHIDRAGVCALYDYDQRGDLTETLLPSGRRVVIERDARRVTGVTVAGRRVLSLAYDEAGLPSSISDGEGNTFRVSWGKDGRTFTVRRPDGAMLQATLNAARELIAVGVPGGQTTEIKRDRLGNVIAVRSEGGEDTYTYDTAGRLTSEHVEGAPAANYAYDAAGRLSEVSRGPHALRLVRDAAGRVTRAELDDGQWASAAYDEAGRMTSAEDSHGRTLVCAYDEAGRLRRATDAAGSWVEWSYDKAGRPVRSLASSGAESAVAYGFDGRVRSVSDNRTGGFSIVRDALGRATASFDDEGLLFEARRDTRGAITSTKNAVGETAHFERDWAGRVVRVAADGVSASVSRDADGRVSGVDVTGGPGGPSLLKERYSYTRGGRVSSVEGPLGRESFRWARDGSLRSREDALGITTLQTSMDGRSMRVARPDGSVWEASLSRDLRLATVSDGGASVAVSFDELGRPAHADMGGGAAVDYEYDRAGRLLSVAHSEAPKVVYTYDGANRVSAITQGDMGVRYAYDDAGRVVRRGFSDGTSVSYAYDGRGRLATLAARGADGHDALSEGYAYDRLGRRVARTVTRDGATSELAYSYDGAGRLLSVSEDGRERDAWDYDALGNVLRASTPRGTTTYAYDAAGRMVRSEGPEGSRRYEWDARSRLSRVTDGEGTPVLELSWDAADRLVSSTGGRGTTTYGYDALGNRVSQEGPDGSLRWAVDPLRLTRNTLAWGRGGDLRPALADGAMPLWSSGTCLVSDANGTPLATTSDLAAALLEDPFGRGSWDGLAFGYAGYAPDPATGLLHARLRDYDPSARRFCSPDPRRGHATSPRTLNRWACCFGDPVNLVDVDGGWPDVGGWFSDRMDDIETFWDKQIVGIDRTLYGENVEINGMEVGGDVYQHTSGGIFVVQRDEDNTVVGINLNTPSISIPGTEINISATLSLNWTEQWGVSASVNYANDTDTVSSYGLEVSSSGIGVKYETSTELPNVVGTTIGTRASVGMGFSWPQIGLGVVLVGASLLVVVAYGDNSFGAVGVDEVPASAAWLYTLQQLLSAPSFTPVCTNR
ncbi:DUF6531 domain-containing protein [Olsenella sp. Marseille-P4559]|uniref:DUF6531 domain-containing protein n=1 Tax=Olsenella sp. Marseille-P4559 TaxID=2364795 RepID=UPI0013EF47C3|nr:DUF6531 domain-containing protein [Olsenella sp. Marseille-P4559]